MIRNLRYLLPALLVTSAAPAQTAPFHDLAALDRDIAMFLGAAIGEDGGAASPVDRRLRLATCRAPLSLEWHGTRQDTVVVQCPEAGGWRLFVAVGGKMRQAVAAAAASTLAVTRGDALTIVVAGEGFSVSQAGEAVESGPLGGWIRVRTSVRATPIRARIERPGLVIVPAD